MQISLELLWKEQSTIFALFGRILGQYPAAPSSPGPFCLLPIRNNLTRFWGWNLFFSDQLVCGRNKIGPLWLVIFSSAFHHLGNWRGSREKVRESSEEFWETLSRDFPTCFKSEVGGEKLTRSGLKGVSTRDFWETNLASERSYKSPMPERRNFCW